ncbi:unnamed protein product [Choristocarpus tenellus]
MSSTPQLVRLASVRTVRRRAAEDVRYRARPSYTPMSDLGLSMSPVGTDRKNLSNSLSVSERSDTTHGDQDLEGFTTTTDEVRIEVCAHRSIEQASVLLASLSNSILLVMRRGSEGSAFRRCLLDWTVQGKIRGLCISHDLQCALCITDGLAVYLLPIEDLHSNGDGGGSATQGAGNSGPGTLQGQQNPVAAASLSLLRPAPPPSCCS